MLLLLLALHFLVYSHVLFYVRRSLLGWCSFIYSSYVYLLKVFLYFGTQVGLFNQINRKIFSSNLGHLSIIFIWLSGMLFHASFFSNYNSWLRDSQNVISSAHLVWFIISEDLLNTSVGGFINTFILLSLLLFLHQQILMGHSLLSLWGFEAQGYFYL